MIHAGFSIASPDWNPTHPGVRPNWVLRTELRLTDWKPCLPPDLTDWKPPLLGARVTYQNLLLELELVERRRRSMARHWQVEHFQLALEVERAEHLFVLRARVAGVLPARFWTSGTDLTGGSDSTPCLHVACVVYQNLRLEIVLMEILRISINGIQ